MDNEYDSLDDDHTIKPAPMDLSMGDEATVRGSYTTKRFRIGDVILNRYRITGELGQGGMGVVYKCFDQTGGIEVALKSLPPELSHDSNEMEEVRENFQMVSRLVHTHIAQIRTLERDEASGDYYLIMELVDGSNLRKWKKTQGGLTVEQIIPIARQVATALDYAHSQGIIHRDIKPSNIMVSQSATKAPGIRQGAIGNASESSVPSVVNNLSVKVLDFGLAAQIHTSLSRVSQVRHGTSGTGPYMAPEQWRGQYQDAATDQYALAAMIYELLSGRPPFESHDPTVLREAVLNEAVPKPDNISPAQWKILERALSKDRKERFRSCGEFVAALGGGKVRSQRAQRNAKGSKKGRWVAGLLIVGVLAGGGYFGVRWQEKNDAEVNSHEQLVAELPVAVTEDQATPSPSTVPVVTEEHSPPVQVTDENRKARNAMLEAQQIHDDLINQDLDKGQGFGKKFSELKKQRDAADAAYAAEDWTVAIEECTSLQKLCDQIADEAINRQNAVDISKAANLSREEAKKARAEELAKEAWHKGENASSNAKEHFDAGDFIRASGEWDKARVNFQSAESYAIGITSVFTARNSYERRKKEIKTEMGRDGGEQWKSAEGLAEKALSMAEERKWSDSVEKFHQATAMLDSAEKEALQAQEKEKRDISQKAKAAVVDNRVYFTEDTLSPQSETDAIKFKSFPSRFQKAEKGKIFDSRLNKTWVLYDPKELLNFDAAKSRALKIGGRLPNEAELASLLTLKRADTDWARLNGDIFPRHRLSRFWTADEKKWYLPPVWKQVDFVQGSTYKASEDDVCAVLVILDH